MNTLRISNESLILDILEPEACPGSRFDRTGWIRQVQLVNGGHTFCMAEKEEGGEEGADELTGGSGLCGEFGLTEAIGYEETGPGGSFPKLGIGLLERDSKADYDFQHPYPVSVPYEVSVFLEQHRVAFTVYSKDCRGYAALLHKEIALKESAVRIKYRLTNVGTRSIRTTEYVHNFMGVNGCPIGPDYSLRVGFPMVMKRMEEHYTPHILRFNHVRNEIMFAEKAEREFYCQLSGLHGNEAGAWWELRHSPSGVGVRETASFPLDYFALWGTKHTVSPEMFIRLEVEPGESAAWSRSYDFFTG
jgi:hypothetical protein